MYNVKTTGCSKLLPLGVPRESLVNIASQTVSILPERPLIQNSIEMRTKGKTSYFSNTQIIFVECRVRLVASIRPNFGMRYTVLYLILDKRYHYGAEDRETAVPPSSFIIAY